MIGPNGGQGSESSWGFDVSDQTDNFEWWGFDDGDGFDCFFLIEFGLGSVNISQDVSHTGFETSEGGEVTFFGFVIFWEGSYSSSVMFGSVSWAESEISLSWA
jgi:hypothetical protein